MWTSNRREKLKKAARAIIFTAGFVWIFLSLTKLMQYKAAITRMEPFFDIEEPVDVMLFGTSHVIDGILPYELWGGYGISSYNFGNNAARIPLTYWKMMNVFDYQVPKLVIVDCSYLSSNSKLCTTLQQSHNILDGFPLSKTKIAAINDLFEEEDKQEFLWPFSVYHNRWDELTKADFVTTYNDELGATPYYTVSVPAVYEKLPEGTKISNKTVAMEYIGKLVTSCRERGVEVLLTYLPCPANAKRQKEANSMVELAEQYGVGCINFLDLDVVDFTTDCKDADSHLNASGAKKVTKYLGDYIREHYDIPDHSMDREFSGWKKKYATYLSNKFETLDSQKLLSSYLLLLADQDLHSLVYVREDSAVLRDARLSGLLENIRQYGNQSKIQILSPDDFAAACGEDGADLVTEVRRVDSGGEVSRARFVVKNELPLIVNRTE